MVIFHSHVALPKKTWWCPIASYFVTSVILPKVRLEWKNGHGFFVGEICEITNQSWMLTTRSLGMSVPWQHPNCWDVNSEWIGMSILNHQLVKVHTETLILVHMNYQKKTGMRNLSFLWNSEVFTNEFSSIPQFYGSSFSWVSFNPNPSSLGIPYNFEPYPIVANYIKVCTLFSFKNFPRASAFTGHACKRVGNGVEPIDMVPQLVERMLTGTTGYPTNTMFGRCFILLCGNPMYMDVRSCQLAR